MQSVRELVGALTQARVQMMAVKAIIEDEANNAEDDAERDALELDAQKLTRCLGVIGDVRDRIDSTLRGPKEPPAANGSGS